MDASEKQEKKHQEKSTATAYTSKINQQLDKNKVR